MVLTGGAFIRLEREVLVTFRLLRRASSYGYSLIRSFGNLSLSCVGPYGDHHERFILPYEETKQRERGATHPSLHHAP